MEIPDINVIDSYIYKKNKYVFNKMFLSASQVTDYSKPIGLYDPLGLNINPLTGKKYENIYSNVPMSFSVGPLAGQKYATSYPGLAYSWTNLIIYSKIDEIITSIRTNQVTLIKAGTGVGKTVITPKAALQAFNFQKKVICAIPKRGITKTTADYAASCLDVKLGEEVGYRYKGDNKSSASTKLLFTTTGTIKSIITGLDPYLDEYSCLIIDEAHERSVQIDQVLYFAKKILAKRPDFRIIIMSATIDTTLFKSYFTDFTYKDFDFPGKTYPVDIIYEKASIPDWKVAVVTKLNHILNTTTTGDILIFTKSGGEGRQFCDGIKTLYSKTTGSEIPYCAVLEGRSSKSDQDLAIKEFNYLSLDTGIPGVNYSRKIVTATNVAESSITIDGLSYVIDCGYALVASYFPDEDASSLLEERISQAAATQRSGRVGRTKKGTCYRLYTEKEYLKFNKFPTPDMQKTDLISDILDICTMPGIKSLSDARDVLNELISPPDINFVETSIDRLYKLNAISNDIVTPIGFGVSLFRTISPEFAAAMIAGHYYNCKMDVINIITILHRIEFRMEKLYLKYTKKSGLSADANAKARSELFNKQRRFTNKYGDHLTCLNVYTSLRKAMAEKTATSPREWCKNNGISSHVFVERDGQNWDRIKSESMRYASTVESIIRPVELKIKYYSDYVKDGGKYSLVELKKQLAEKNNNVGDDGEEEIEEAIIKKEEQYREEQLGGAIRPFKKSPPYEMDFFPNANDLGSRDNNIMKSFLLGCGFNVAEFIDKNIYKTIFPFNRRTGIPDMNSSCNTNKTKYILYGQLFMSNKNAKNLKFNIVSTITELYKKTDAEVNDDVIVNKKLKDDYKLLLSSKKAALLKSPAKKSPAKNKKVISAKKSPAKNKKVISAKKSPAK